MTIVLTILGIAYPFAVYASMGHVPPGVFVILALALLAGRVAILRGRAIGRVMLPPLAAVAIGTIALGLADAAIAAKTYPVLMSFAFAAAFGLSMLKPPSLIEIFATLTDPEPSPAARTYMRKVSAVWCGFLLINGALSLVTALWGSAALWALYNGLIAYLLMGALFGGEWLVRRHVRAQQARP